MAHIVIIGAGVGGVPADRVLREALPPVQSLATTVVFAGLTRNPWIPERVRDDKDHFRDDKERFREDKERFQDDKERFRDDISSLNLCHGQHQELSFLTTLQGEFA